MKLTTLKIFKAMYRLQYEHPDKVDFINKVHDIFDELEAELNGEVKFLQESGISKKRPAYYQALKDIIEALKMLEDKFLKAVDYDE